MICLDIRFERVFFSSLYHSGLVSIVTVCIDWVVIFSNWIKAFTTSPITRLRLSSAYSRLSHRFAFDCIYHFHGCDMQKISFSVGRFSMHMLIFSDRRMQMKSKELYTNRSIWAEICGDCVCSCVGIAIVAHSPWFIRLLRTLFARWFWLVCILCVC